MAIAVRDHASRKGGAGTAPTITVPATVVAGDIMVVSVSWNSGSTMTAPSGWTLLNTGSYASVGAGVLVKTADAGDAGSSPVFPLDVNAQFTVALAAFSGASGWAAHSLDAGANGLAVNCPSVTTGTGDVVVAAAMARGTVNADQPAFTFSTLLDQISGSTANKNCATAIGWYTPSSSGATGAKTITSSKNVDAIGGQVVLTATPPSSGYDAFVWDGAALLAADAFVWDGSTLIAADADVSQ